MLFNPLSMEVTALVVIFVFVSVMVASQNRAKERREKLRIIEDAIRSGNLDAATKQELVAELTGRRPEAAGRPVPRPVEGRRSGWARLSFAVGWLTLFLGIGFLCVDEREMFFAGSLLAVIGFGFVSLPLALRELDRERAGARSAPRQ